MMNHDRPNRVMLASMIAAAALLAGCEKKETPRPQATSSSGGMTFDRAPKPTVSIADLNLHPKVQFPEERLPASPEMARAIADLASAIASGSADRLQPLITPRDRVVLDMLVRSGEWKRRADSLKVVRVCVVNQPQEGWFQVGLGLEDSNGAFLMGWEATGNGEAWTASNMPIESRIASAASGLDGAELKLMGLPTGIIRASSPMLPIDSPKEEEEEKKDRPRKPRETPGLLKRERI